MHESKCVTVPLAVHLQLSDNQKPKNDAERHQMEKIPYSNLVGSLMYTMVYGGSWKRALRSSQEGAEVSKRQCRQSYIVPEEGRYQRSQSGYIFTLFGSAVSWKSSLQSVVALSTTEAEYMAATEAVKEAVWLKGLVHDFGIEESSLIIKFVYSDEEWFTLAELSESELTPEPESELIHRVHIPESTHRVNTPESEFRSRAV
ncbi:secreted RxLR effector protein 161-like [Salvia miltiorrhiza]|uniref:secreted RxLR effector protein 161-like n=1 Tax=Salvia miltiorrhiza TaxID=226208 RepID=UPI0025AC8C21|nr:secreted RxLR effector protein 161-like [Salvia miltiorrhiza]